jgi:hypothetical protein
MQCHWYAVVLVLICAYLGRLLCANKVAFCRLIARYSDICCTSCAEMGISARHAQSACTFTPTRSETRVVLYHGTYALIAVVSYHSHTTYVVAQYMRMSFRWCVAHAIVPCAATGQIRLSFAVRRPCCGGWLRSRLDIDWYSSGVFCGLTATYTCSRQNVNLPAG